jgi:photosystem II stability/assembly factor-like uncharacterized protein
MNSILLRTLAIVFFVPSALAAQLPDLSAAMHWRSIGPFRGGRTRAAAGDPTRPYTFYMAQVNGGVWKTDDAGRTWIPIFDGQPTQSVGALAIAPSDPNTIYVGSGEGLPRPDLSVGDGIYKSSDGGKTWQHLGLRDAQQIPQIAVDPKNPLRIFVAALGHPYGPNKERGVYRSLDGGKTFTPVLQKSVDVGANDVDIDPSNPMVVYANLWEQRQGPWENAAWTGNGGGLFKSSDGGETWKQLTNGLPPTTNQVNLMIAPSNPQRLYAAVGSDGPPAAVDIYRSDNAGESWTKTTEDRRPALRIGGGDLPVPIVSPTDPDMVIMGSIVAMKSTDGGRTWVPLKGAPGGDDYQNGWISPADPNIILLVSDQGAVVTLNGGRTWSSWYNQPTAQLYHVMADNAFPYRLCSGQQESGSACVSSRGNWGEITTRDWAPVGVDEYGYAAPDPLHPDIVYGGRSVTRFDRATGTVSVVGPLAGRAFGPGQSPYRQVRTQPVVFSQADPRVLFFGNNVLWKTIDGGLSWQQISPDLTRTTWQIPASVGKYTDTSLVQQRGVIYTIGPSPTDANVIWIGTDDGVIQRTSDGGLHWANVTPPQIGPWWKLFMIDAGHFDTQTAYAAVNTLRLDDMRPHLYRTHDGGRTWTDIARNFTANGKRVTDLASLGPANAVREDPKKKGLLYAATEKGVWVSLDDGNSWQSLQLNLPASSVRDLIVKDDDIAVATHGRGFWILDDVTALRQITPDVATREATLFKPTTALRVRWNTNSDTPLPPDEPMGENPAEGVPIDYYLKGARSDVVSLEVLDARNRVVRRYASADSLPWKVPDAATAPVPLYWYRAPQALPATAGLHRFQWDVRYQPIPGSRTGGFGGGLPISATPRNTAPSSGAPLVAPGSYTVRLVAGGKTYTQPITVEQDPRATATPAALREVYALTDSMYWTLTQVQESIALAETLRKRLTDSTAVASVTAILDPQQQTSLSYTSAAIARLLNGLQSADVPVTATSRTEIQNGLRSADVAIARWRALAH